MHQKEMHSPHMGPCDLIVISCLLYHSVQNWKYIIIIITRWVKLPSIGIGIGIGLEHVHIKTLGIGLE